MSNQSVSCHQVGIISAILLLSLKFTNLPALFFEINGIGGVVSIFAIFILNLLFICFLLILKYKFKDKSFYEILSKSIGIILAKTIFFVLFIFFVFKLLSLISDGFGFVRDVADEEYTGLKFLICFIPVCCSLAKTGIRNIGRTAEFFFPYIMIGLVISILLSFVPVDIWGVGTQIKGTFGGFFNTLFKFSFWNGDLFALLIFLDKIKIEKKQIKKIIIPFVFTGLLLVCTYAVYYSLYQQTSIFHTNMLYDIVQYAIGTSSGWHMDIFAIIVFSVCIILQGSIFIYCANDCIKKIFCFGNDSITISAVVIVLVFANYLFLDDYFEFVMYAKNYLSWLAIGLIVVLPIILLLSLIKRSFNNAKF